MASAAITPIDLAKSSDAQRWAAVSARDAAHDGAFVYAVATTGVYCRPSCPSRRPRREHVKFYVTCAAAEFAGFRACKRCKPVQNFCDDGTMHQNVMRIAAACRLIESAEKPPALAVLAQHVSLSPHHFHRQFKAVTGMTPKAYATAHRLKQVQAALRRPGTVTDAVYAAGFSSNSRFYAAADAILGMQPRVFKSGGRGAVLMFAIGDCSLGCVLVAATAKGVAAVLLGDDPATLLRDLQDRFPRAQLIGGDSDFDHLAGRAIAAVENPSAVAQLPLDVQGTVFQHNVWAALRAIPAGTTATYSGIARSIGMPSSARAVAAACAANPVAVIVPCHRVVRVGGELSGYRWGLERKKALLEREAIKSILPAKKKSRG